MIPPISTSTELERELSVGEHVLWSGQPKPGLQLRLTDAVFIPFSLIWAGVIVSWARNVFSSGVDLFFLPLSIFLLCIGVYMIIGRFFVDAAIRAKTWYGVTNERVMIITGLINRTVTTLPLGSLSEIALEQRRDGSGTMTFGTSTPFAFWYRGIRWPGVEQRLPPAFDLIPDAKTVYEIIRQAQHAA